jgi:hypothetical protein
VTNDSATPTAAFPGESPEPEAIPLRPEPEATKPAPLSAGKLAALIAIPIALIAGFAAFQLLKPAGPHGNSTEPVTTTARQLTAAETAACSGSIAKMPAQIQNLTRRPVTAGPEQNAAYGDPALTVVCGGSTPTFAATDWVYVLEGVCWHPDADGNSWTTVDRQTAVTMTLPKDLAGNGSAQWAIAISPAIRESIQQSEKIPTGCKPG